MLTHLLVLAAFAITAASAGGHTNPSASECAACTDESCQIRDNVKVQSLCADSICVQGDPVLVGDNDPCTNSDFDKDGKIVHVPIANCCQKSADCAKFFPDTCVISECEIAPGGSFGFCIHTTLKAPECCDCAADCPKKACFNRACEPTTAGAAVFIDEGSSRALRRLHPEQDIINVPGTCVYTPVPPFDPEDPESSECCVTSSDCINGGPNTTPVCDASNECVYVASTEFQCTEDIECQQDDVKNTKCGCKGECFANFCDRGWCACKQDFTIDADGDGVCCKEDCDDSPITGKNISAPILCPVGNLTEIDRDKDNVYECGVFVIEVCNTTCPNGAKPINRTDVERSKRDWNVFFLAYNCDCCSDAPGPDETICCGIDQNKNRAFARVPGEEDSPTPCITCACVPQIPSNHTHHGGKDQDEDEDNKKKGNKDTTPAQRDAQCVAEFGAEFLFVPQQLRDEPCDLCDTTPVVGDEVIQPISCPAVANGKAVCSTTDVQQCCEEILKGAAQTPGNIPPYIAPFVECCRNETGTCKPGVPGFPVISDQCVEDCESDTNECFPEDSSKLPTFGGKIQYTGEAVLIQCVFDKDHDCYFNCGEIKDVCINLPEKGNGTHGHDDDDDCDDCEDKKKEHGGINPKDLLNLDPNNPADQTLLCRLVFGDKFPVAGVLEAFNDVPEQDIKNGAFDGSFCDCDDKKTGAFEFIVCIKDEDNDGFPAAKQFYSKTLATCDLEREPACVSECSDKCPKGYRRPDDCKEAHCALGGEQRKQQALADLKTAAEKHGWFEGDKKGGHDDDDEDDKHKQCKKRQERFDEKCSDVQCDAFDCCDKDNLAYPGSTVGSALRNKCGFLDNNCDCKVNSAAACAASPGRPAPVDINGRDGFFNLGAIVSVPDQSSTYATGIYPLSDNDNQGVPILDNGYLFQFVYDNTGTAKPQMGDCVTTGGVAIEELGPGRKKRQVPLACRQAPKLVLETDIVTVAGVPDVNGGYLKHTTVDTGDCVEFLQASLIRLDTQSCQLDFEICQKLTI